MNGQRETLFYLCYRIGMIINGANYFTLGWKTVVTYTRINMTDSGLLSLWTCQSSGIVKNTVSHLGIGNLSSFQKLCYLE